MSGCIMRRMCRHVWTAVLLFACTAAVPSSQDLPRGTIIDAVTCVDDRTQSYALYLPSTYSPDRAWNVLMGFHPSGRGRAIVEAYQAAAEQYGYIVAGSNNSRNGPWSVSIAAVRAMSGDLARRFAIDAERVYLTGHSGGSRLAMQVALDSPNIAGVIASSAGYADSRPRASVRFAVFATTGTEDFNYIEMRMLDRKLKSPHHLAVFTGGHTLPPNAVALEAIEWMELQAIRSRRRSRDDVLINALFEKRQRQVAASTEVTATVHVLEALVSDFADVHDVSAETARLTALSKQPEVKRALARERDADDEEARVVSEIIELEANLENFELRAQTLGRLRDRLSRWARAANADAASPERSRARRVLRAITAGAAERVRDVDYRKLLDEYRQAAPPTEF
jgi:hypothetical protein